MKRVKRTIKKYYNWSEFIEDSRRITRNQTTCWPYIMTYYGPDAEKIAKEVDSEVWMYKMW